VDVWRDVPFEVLLINQSISEGINPSLTRWIRMASKTDVLHIGEENEEILSRKTEMDFYWVPVTDWFVC